MKQVLFLFIAVIFITSCNSATEQQEIKLKLQQGATYTTNQLSTMQIHQEIQGQSVDMDIEITAQLSFEVKSIEDNIYTFDTKYDNMAMKMTSAYMSLDIDPNKETDTNPFEVIMRKMLKGMMGKSFVIKMNTTGDIKEISGFENIFASVLEDIAAEYGDVDEATMANIKNQLAQAYGDESLKGSFEMIYNVYNEQPVNVNDKWEKSIDLQAGMQASYNVTYTFAEKNSEGLKINAEGKLETADKDAYTKINGMDAKYLLEGDYKGDYVLDAETGWIKSATLNFEAGGDVVIQANENLPDGMTFPMSMKGKTSIK